MKNEFEHLIKKLSPTLRKISHRLNGHFAFFNDDDLCQEALAHLWVSFREGRLNDKTDSYILQGCYYHLKNYIRTNLDKANLTSIDKPIDDEGTMLQEIIPSEDTSVFNGMEEASLHNMLENNGLSGREKQVLDLCLRGLTTREAGQKLGISHVAVVKLRKKIREKCKLLKKEISSSYQN